MHKYQQVFFLGIQNAMIYRANFFLSLFSGIFPMGMQLFLWYAIFNNAPTDKVYGYDLQSMLAYVVIAAIVSKLVDTSVKWDIHGDIKDGGLSKFIIRPIGYLRFRVANFMGQKCLQMTVVIVVLSTGLLALHHSLNLPLTFSRSLLFLVAITLALILNLTIAFIVSAIAFWLTEAWASFVILDVAILIASGGIFPLDLFGTKVMQILAFLPFQYIIYFPTNILNGTLALSGIINGLLMQGFWIGIMMSLNALVWKVGFKKFVAVGG